MMELKLSAALNDDERYLDVFAMNYTDDGAHSNDNEPKGTLPDYYDLMVRSINLDEDSIYLEIDEVPEHLVEAVQCLLITLYQLDEVAIS